MNNVNRKQKSSKSKIDSKPQWRKKRDNRTVESDECMEDKIGGRAKKFPQDKAKNDPNWYFKDSQILKDVASFSFNKPLGTGVDLTPVYPENVVSQMSTSVPGLMSIVLGLTPGVATDAQSPVNLAATNVYSFVRYKNSGAANYDAPDLMLYLIAMDSLYSAWNWMKRIYGEASTYSQLNRYQPRAYLAAEGVDFDDIIENLADFRAFLNIKSQEIKSFCVPAVMTYMVRHAWLFSNIFTDSETRKAQSYMYVPGYFYQYSETTSTSGGELVPVKVLAGQNPNTMTKLKFGDLKNILNGMLEAVNYSEDIGIMSGDILKAYGEGNLFTLSIIDPDYRVEPVYSREVLTQIENLVCIAYTDSDSTQFNIKQDPNTNFIKFQPTITTSAEHSVNGTFLNFHWDSPTPDDVIVASRLLTTWELGGSTGSRTLTLTSCGSEIALQGYMWAFVQGSNPSTGSTPPLIGSSMQLYAVAITGITPGTAMWLQKIAYLYSFDWAPRVSIESTDDTAATIYGVTWDWDNYVYIDNDDVSAMNLVALLSEFNVPT